MKQSKCEHTLRINLLKSYAISLPIIALATFLSPNHLTDILLSAFAAFHPLIHFGPTPPTPTKKPYPPPPPSRMTAPYLSDSTTELESIHIHYDDYQPYEYSHEAPGFVADLDPHGHIPGTAVLDASEKLDFNGETSPELRAKVE